MGRRNSPLNTLCYDNSNYIVYYRHFMSIDRTNKESNMGYDRIYINYWFFYLCNHSILFIMSVVSAEEFLLSHRWYNGEMTSQQEQDLLVIMSEFAETHRKEALKQASIKARVQHVVTGGADYYIVNKDSILNAYSKKNIK